MTDGNESSGTISLPENPTETPTQNPTETPTGTPPERPTDPKRQRREMPAPPDISVVITALDAGLYLEEAIRSVLAQRTSFRWELLIVDDGSVDATERIAREYAARYPGQIMLLHHAGRVNRGISASRNLGLAHATAPVLALLDADDVWLPDRLETQMPLLLARPEVAMVYAQAERWLDFELPFEAERGSLGRNFVPPLLPAGERDGVIGPPELLRWFLADESLAPCTCTVLVRTEVARRLGGFASEFTGLYDDQVFYAKLALAEPIAVSTRCVARYRQHAGSCCAMARERATEGETRAMFLEWLARYERTSQQAWQPELALVRTPALPTPGLFDSRRSPIPELA